MHKPSILYIQKYTEWTVPFVYENTSNTPKKKDKNLRFYGFLGCSNTLLVIIARGNRGKGTG